MALDFYEGLNVDMLDLEGIGFVVSRGITCNDCHLYHMITTTDQHCYPRLLLNEMGVFISMECGPRIWLWHHDKESRNSAVKKVKKRCADIYNVLKSHM